MSQETIKIGFIAPLTGSQANLGEISSTGLEIAKEEINAAGGINGEKLEIVYEDDKNDPKQGVAAYKKLVEINNVKVILPLMSGTVLAIAPQAGQDKVIVLSPSASSTKIAAAGDYIFRIREKGEKHGKFMAEYALQRNWSRIAILAVNHENGISYRDAFAKRLSELGGNSIYSDTYTIETADFRSALVKIKSLNPDAVYIPGFVQNVAAILKQAKEIQLTTQFLGTQTSEDQQLLTIAETAADGFIYTSPLFDTESKEPKVAHFMDEYRKRSTNEAVLFLAANAYDALKITAEAMKQCDEDTLCIKNYLYTVKDYEGIGGKITFDMDGEVDKQLMLKTVQNNTFMPIFDKK